MYLEDENDGLFSRLAAFGFNLTPLLPKSKAPAVRWQPYLERKNAEAEAALWDTTSFNPGVIVGPMSGTVVFDAEGLEAIRAFEKLLGQPTPTVLTPRGVHFYVASPPDHVGNCDGLLGLQLSLYSHNRYVVGAGATHPNGATYEWGATPDEVPYAPFPMHALRER